MTMQLAFEAVSTDADRLSFHERSTRLWHPAGDARKRSLPHVDDLLFALALAGLLAVGGAQLVEAVDYAAAAQPVAVTATAAAAMRTPG